MDKKTNLCREFCDDYDDYMHYTFFHGTSDVMNITLVLPPDETEILRETWRKRLKNKVFFTTSLLSAKQYALKACSRFGGKPVVYEVRPVGDVWHLHDQEYVADRAEIVRTIRE